MHSPHFSVTPIDSPNRPQPFEFDVCAMPVLRSLHLSSWICCAGQSVGIPDVDTRTPSAAPLPRTALRTLTSIVSQALPPNTCNDSEHDRGSSSSSYPPHTKLEALTLHLNILNNDYVELSSSRFENMGWEEFAGVVGELAAMGKMSLESEREAMQVDLKPMMGWETMLEVYRRPTWEEVMGITRSAVSATSVIVIVSLYDGRDDLVEGLLEEKLGWLREKGVGLGIHPTR